MVVFKGFAHQNLIGKLFGNKGRRTPSTILNILPEEDPKKLIEKILVKEFDRNKRNLRKYNNLSNQYDVQKVVYERKSTVRTNVFDQSALATNDNSKLKNYAYVDVNLVPKPTAFVKLKESTKSKVKNLFNKLKFKKSKKGDNTPKKHKRDVIRAPRFNPFKKIKSMFKGENEKLSTLSYKDLTLMSSKINAFKIIKYDKVPTIDEMKKQIPNINQYVFPEGNIEDSIMATERNFDDYKYSNMDKINLWDASLSLDKPMPTQIEKPTWDVPKIERVDNKPLKWQVMEPKRVKPINLHYKIQPWEKAIEDARHWGKSSPESTWANEVLVTFPPKLNASTTNISTLTGDHFI